MTLVNDIKRLFKQGDIITKLLIINTIAFILLWIVEIIGSISHTNVYSSVLQNIAVPTNIQALVRKFWTIATFLFFDTSFFSYFCNMIILTWTGRIFLNFMNEKKLLATYILGGLSGLLLSVLCSTFSVDSSNAMVILGPSAAVLAILTAVATYAPNYKIYLLFFGEVSLKIFAIIFAALECIPLLSALAQGPNPHILFITMYQVGGLLYGFMWAYLLRKNIDISLWFLKIINKIENSSKEKKGPVLHTNRHRDEEYVSYEEVRYDEENIDKILEKISKSGYDSLTKEEKETLFKQSKK